MKKTIEQMWEDFVENLTIMWIAIWVISVIASVLTLIMAIAWLYNKLFPILRAITLIWFIILRYLDAKERANDF